jgi:hypothetical protein
MQPGQITSAPFPSERLPVEELVALWSGALL